jgi:hypothetical protein
VVERMTVELTSAAEMIDELRRVISASNPAGGAIDLPARRA